MKKTVYILLLTMGLLLTACANKVPAGSLSASEQPTVGTDASPLGEAGNNALVVYFSRVGNTDFPNSIDAESSASLVINDGELKGNAQLIAEWIADEAGCATYEILTEDKYPIDYRETTDVAKVEQNNNARPSLLNHIEDFDSYSTIYIVYPNWWGDLPQPLYTFFDEYDMSGKIIIPFVTHGGSSFSKTVSAIKEAEPGAAVIEGLSIRDSSVPSSETEIREWVSNNGGNSNE